MKALAEMAKSGTVDKAAAAEHAKKIDGTAQVLVSWFPKGTGPESGIDTKAKPEVWTQADDFKKANDDFRAEAAKLVTAAATGDAATLGPQLAATGKTCSGCHTKFQNK
jgi:cytochrome c556